jgi:RNA polymerase sigma-70 factor (ECF subfamily)
MVQTLSDVQTPDDTLVRRARAGQSSAREELFHRHRGESYRYAYRLLGHEQDALDVVQEAMLKAFSALADFDGRSGFRTWLLRIVTNTARVMDVPIGMCKPDPAGKSTGSFNGETCD